MGWEFTSTTPQAQYLQRGPELLVSSHNDLTGRAAIAAAWFTQAFSDGKGGFLH
jgi:hypothetical protein